MISSDAIQEYRMIKNNLPNFLFIGAQKAGTTLLYNILKRHPEFYLAERKEIHFFDRDDLFSKGIEWYKDIFKKANAHKVIGERTPAYLYLDYVPQRIYDVLGKDVKFLVFLRNPVDRAFSHYWMSFGRGYERLSFEKAISIENERIAKGEYEKRNFSYSQRSRYSKQIERYFELFPVENFKFIIFEEFLNDPVYYISDILRFLGCSTYDLHYDLTERINAGGLNIWKFITGAWINRKYTVSETKKGIKQFIKYGKLRYPSLTNTFRSKMMQHFNDEIVCLEKLLHRDLSIWR